MRAIRKPMSRWLGLIVCASSLLGCGSATITISVDREELQERLDARFPAQREAFLSAVTLENPSVILRDGSDRIGIDLDVRVDAPVIPEQSGSVATTAKIDYEFDEKAFYLSEPEIERLEIPGLSPEQLDMASGAVESIAGAVLDRFPVYELQRRNLTETTAEYVLRDVEVRGGVLRITLGLPIGS